MLLGTLNLSYIICLIQSIEHAVLHNQVITKCLDILGFSSKNVIPVSMPARKKRKINTSKIRIIA